MVRFKDGVEQEDFTESAVDWHCPKCGSEDIQEDASAGDMVCQDCGLVVGDRIVRTDKEWREFQDDT